MCLYLPQGPTEIAMGCENDAASAEAQVDGSFLHNSPLSPLTSSGFNYVAIPPSSALWMIQDLSWEVDSPSNVSVAAVRKVKEETNSREHNW